MSIKSISAVFILVGSFCLPVQAADEFITSAVKPEELEARYTAAIEQRASDILDVLDLDDASTAAKVHRIVVNQYRALRARDAVIDSYFNAQEEGDSADTSKRAEMVRPLSKHLHEIYLTTLSNYLTPEQLEVVKDRMTYDRVPAIHDDYCALLPDLKDGDKDRILELLKAAREKAMDGGSRDEKFSIFQQCQQEIDQYLSTNGYDVAAARKKS